MKTHFAESNVEFFYHRYLIDGKKFNPDKRPKFQNEENFQFNSTEYNYFKTSLHRCRMVKIGEENLENWPLYLLKRISYFYERKERKGKSYQAFDQNIKKISQIRTEYLCYQIMKKSHRVVKMIELINENTKKEEDQKFFYKFLARKKEQGIRNACFILEMCNDGTLEDRILNYRNPLSIDHIIMYCCQILEGLIELKKKGILHRDLRPVNIFLHNDEVKFGDFDSAFIYKESQCSDIKSGIDINTTPQEIVELASMSDEELEEIGNLKLFDLQAKCDIYFFGMIIFRMVFRREYEKNFEGTDLEYLVREKIKEGFVCPELLDVMKKCLYKNVEKRMDLLELFEKMKSIEKQHYFTSEFKQRMYLSEDALNLFSFNSLEPQEPDIISEIESSIMNTFTLSFVSVEYDFENDFERASLARETRLYADEVLKVHSRYYKVNENVSTLWSSDLYKRKELDAFLERMEEFLSQTSVRAYYYDYLYKVILKISTRSMAKKEHKQIVTENRQKMEESLIIVLKFLFEILARTPFKIDKNYDTKNLPYETRKLFKDKVKINDKFNFFAGRMRMFDYEKLDVYEMINKFYSIEYEDVDSDKFETIYDNINYLIDNIDNHLKTLLRESIVDLFRPYDAAKKAKLSQLKETLFIMITLEKQELKKMRKSHIVMMKNLLEPLFSGKVTLDGEEAQMFFDDFKIVYKKEVEESKHKENVKISMNLLAVSKKHLDTIAKFMAPFAGDSKNTLTNSERQKVSEKNQSNFFNEEFKEEYDNVNSQEEFVINQKSVKLTSEGKVIRGSKNKTVTYGLEAEKDHEQPLKENIEVEPYEQNDFNGFEEEMEQSQSPILA